MKARFIQSPFHDDKITPDIPRYYINQISTNIFLFFSLFLLFSISFFFNNDIYAILKAIWYLYSNNIEALKSLTYSLYKTNDVSILNKSIIYSLSIPFLSSVFFVFLITKPITRRVYKSGRTVNNEKNVISNYVNYVNRTSGLPEKEGLSLFKKTDICAAIYITFKEFEDVLYSNADQEKGFIVAGDAGSGKSVVINHFYKDIALTRKDIGLVHNIKGDDLNFISSFASCYNIAATSINGEPIHAINFLSLLLDEDKSIQKQNIYTFIEAFSTKEKGGDNFFSLGSKEVNYALIEEALSSNPTPETFLNEIVVLFSKPAEQQINDLQEYLLRHNPAAAGYINIDNPKATMSVIASCINVIKKFQVLYEFWKNARHIDIKKDFFLKEKPRKFLILTNNPIQADVCNSYISAIINLSSRFLISPNYINPFKRKVYFVIDEFPQLTSVDIETFLKLPDVGRSKGIRCIVALQRFSQIKENFNADPLNFYSAFHNKILGRMTEADFSLIKETIGKTTVEDSLIKKTMQKDGGFTSVYEKNVHDIEAMKPNELSLTCGPKVINGKFLGVQMYYFIQGYNEIFTFIRTPVDVSELVEKFKVIQEKARRIARAKAARAKIIEASTTGNLVLEVPTLANAQETSPSPAPAVPELVNLVSQVDSPEAEHLQEEINQTEFQEDELNNLELMLNLMETKE